MEENKFIQPKPENYMILAILTTVCCCLPLGIISILKASKVNTYYALKEYVMAEHAAQEAKKYAIIGIVIGVALNFISFIIYFTSAL